jgi:hypothetical protein
LEHFFHEKKLTDDSPIMGFSHQKLGLQADDLRRAVTLTMATMGWRNHGMALGLGKPWVFFPWENMGKHGKIWVIMGKYGKSWKCTY